MLSSQFAMVSRLSELLFCNNSLLLTIEMDVNLAWLFVCLCSFYENICQEVKIEMTEDEWFILNASIMGEEL